ncbi:sigma factor, partial [Conexibacter stalactiti]
MTSDAALLAAARTDPDAFRELYDRHARAIHDYFVRRSGSADAAFELTAETFAQAWLVRARFRDEASASATPWLYGIARLGRRAPRHHRACRARPRPPRPRGAARPSLQHQGVIPMTARDTTDARLDQLGDALRAAAADDLGATAGAGHVATASARPRRRRRM